MAIFFVSEPVRRSFSEGGCFLCLFVAKNPFNQRNPRLMNYLCAYKAPYKALYICRDTFTDVMSALQIRLFMQNKAKFRKSQMNVNKVLTRDYEKRTLGERGKKQSQTNPNKAKFKKAKMNVTSIIIKGYKNKPPIRAPKKQSQISKRQKPTQTSLPKGIMKNSAFSGPGKTNPNKPNACPPSVWRVKGKKMLLFTFMLWVLVGSLCCSRVYLENVG